MSLLYMFRVSKCPSSGESHCIYATLLFFTLDGWRLLGWLKPTDQTPPIQGEKYQCRIETVIFFWWCALGCTKNV